MSMADYEISCGNASARVSSLGAELCSYRSAESREYIWQADPAVWGSHGPNLFPLIGVTVNGQISIEGRNYRIPKHGVVRHKEFAARMINSSSIEMVYAADETSGEMYPYDFTLRVAYTIREDGFDTAYTVENHDRREMPFCLGGHPGFLCPMYAGEAFEDYAIRFEEPETGLVRTMSADGCINGQKQLALRDGTTLCLNHEMFDHDALIFDGIRSRRVCLENRSTGKGLAFSFPDFNVLALWTKPGARASYLCLEPWNGLPPLEGETGRFEDKPYVRRLGPGQIYQAGYAMRVIA